MLGPRNPLVSLPPYMFVIHILLLPTITNLEHNKVKMASEGIGTHPTTKFREYQSVSSTA